MLLENGRDRRARNKNLLFFNKKVLTNKSSYGIIIIERERGNDYDDKRRNDE